MLSKAAGNTTVSRARVRTTGSMRREAIRRVIAAYDNLVIRAYCRGRFLILRGRFLDEIGQYLPEEGTILDIGCGFGLFSLYYAQLFPAACFRGIDRDARHVRLATEAAKRLGLLNATYQVRDAREYRSDEAFAAAYMMDLVHHIPPETVGPLLVELYKSLRSGGCLLVKDVDTRPAYKRWFTHALDLVMSPGGVIHYWPAERLHSLLQRVGFRVYRHLMVDALPYPHVLYVCHKDGA
jgi:2-polyprenyl-3-methyl-5-hydroxy-6-metoxy-1,4-benzoquinol methylase